MLYAVCQVLDKGGDEEVSAAVKKLLSRETRQDTDTQNWKHLIVALSTCGYRADTKQPFGELDSAKRAQVKETLQDVKNKVLSSIPQTDLSNLGLDAEIQYKILSERKKTITKLKKYDYFMCIACIVSLLVLMGNLYWNLKFN